MMEKLEQLFKEKKWKDCVELAENLKNNLNDYNDTQIKNFYWWLSQSHKELKQFDTAITNLKIVAQLDNNIKFAEEIAKIYEQQQDWHHAIIQWQIIADNYPDSPLPYFSMGHIYKDKLNDNDNAIAMFQKQTQVFPNRPSGYEGLAQSYEKDQQFELALEYWQTVADKFPTSTLPYWAMGHIYKNHLNNTDKAIEMFQKQIKNFPERPSGYEGLAQSYEKARYFEQAIEQWQIMADKFPTSTLPYWAMGHIYKNHLNNADKAIEMFQKQIEKFPERPSGYEGIGQVYEKFYTPEKVLEFWQGILSTNQHLWEFYFRCGQAYKNLYQYEKAEQTFLSLIDKFPDVYQGYEGLVNVAQHQQNKKLIIERATLFQEKFPQMWQGYWWIGHAYKDLLNYGEAEKQFNELIEKFPNQHQGYEGLVNVAQHQHDWELIITRSEECHTKLPSLWQYYWWTGQAYKNLAQYDEAITQFNILIKKLPNQHQGYEGLVNVAQHQHDWENAVKYSENLMNLFPNLPISYICLINSLKSNKQFIQATDLAKEFIEKFPNHEIAHRLFLYLICENETKDVALQYFHVYEEKFGKYLSDKQPLYSLKFILGNYQEVKQYFEKELVHEKSINPYHKLYVLSNLATIHQCLDNRQQTTNYWKQYRDLYTHTEKHINFSSCLKPSDNLSPNLRIHHELSQHHLDEAKDLFKFYTNKLSELDIVRFLSWFDYQDKQKLSNSLTHTQTTSNTIQSLWIGNDLNIIQQLCLASYLYHGHEVHLYCYQDFQNIPKGVIVKDGNDILPEKEIFYSHGSPAHFSDWFRWRMLNIKSGYWVDMDEICLQPFNFNEDMVFGYESHNINNAVLKFPSYHPISNLMEHMSQYPNQILPWDTDKDIYRKHYRKKKRLDKSHTLWAESSGPMGLTKALEYFNLHTLAKPYYYFYPLNITQTRRLFLDKNFDKNILSESMYATHIWNNAFGKTGLYESGKEISNSMLQYLMEKYNEYLVIA